jgi:hypothetical protein
MPGIDVMILKIFSPKKLAKILTFFAQTSTSFWKQFITTLIFEKNAIFRRKFAKIAEKVIITSTLGVAHLISLVPVAQA